MDKCLLFTPYMCTWVFYPPFTTFESESGPREKRPVVLVRALDAQRSGLRVQMVNYWLGRELATRAWGVMRLPRGG